MRNAWEGTRPRGSQSYLGYVKRLALRGWKVASAKCDRLSEQI